MLATVSIRRWCLAFVPGSVRHRRQGSGKRRGWNAGSPRTRTTDRMGRNGLQRGMGEMVNLQQHV